MLSNPSHHGALPARRRVKIIGTGVSVPGTVLHHEELDRQLNLPPGSTLKATGIESRFISTHETAAMLAAQACRDALADAGISCGEVDCLVAASATMDQALPYNAAMIHAELGLSGHRTQTFDIGASCMSFLTALDLCATLIDAGRFRKILIVSADISTFTTDRSNLTENGIFGDGAAACLICRADEDESSRVLAANSITLSEGVDFCRIPSGGSRFHRRTAGSNSEAVFEMRPRPVFKLVARELPGFVEELLEQASLTMDEIDLVIPHQASHLALLHIKKILTIDPLRMVDITSTHGNQVGASLPTALHHGLKNHKVQRGAKILMLGSGAGVTIGGVIFVY